ncbi:MAG: uncharacterized protein A8A55_2319 [Amphiamblys sp. WSBS2006]|nr:MAG: uncharacterized protein A8A55_2319 [Amphiamblys sp. WSBS2006]
MFPVLSLNTTDLQQETVFYSMVFMPAIVSPVLLFERFVIKTCRKYTDIQSPGTEETGRLSRSSQHGFSATDTHPRHDKHRTNDPPCQQSGMFSRLFSSCRANKAGCSQGCSPEK